MQGETAVMKQAAVRTCNFQIVHEAHVLSILDREHKEHGASSRQPTDEPSADKPSAVRTQQSAEKLC